MFELRDSVEDEGEGETKNLSSVSFRAISFRTQHSEPLSSAVSATENQFRIKFVCEKHEKTAKAAIRQKKICDFAALPLNAARSLFRSRLFSTNVRPLAKTKIVQPTELFLFPPEKKPKLFLVSSPSPSPRLIEQRKTKKNFFSVTKRTRKSLFASKIQSLSDAETVFLLLLRGSFQFAY